MATSRRKYNRSFQKYQDRQSQNQRQEAAARKARVRQRLRQKLNNHAPPAVVPAPAAAVPPPVVAPPALPPALAQGILQGAQAFQQRQAAAVPPAAQHAQHNLLQQGILQGAQAFQQRQAAAVPPVAQHAQHNLLQQGILQGAQAFQQRQAAAVPPVAQHAQHNLLQAGIQQAGLDLRQRQQDRQDPNRPYLPFDANMWRRDGGATHTTDGGVMVRNRRAQAHGKFHESPTVPGVFGEFHIADETRRGGGRNAYYNNEGGSGHRGSRDLGGDRRPSRSQFHNNQATRFDRHLRDTIHDHAQEQLAENARLGRSRVPAITPEMERGMNEQEARDYMRRRRQDERANRDPNKLRLSKQAYEQRKRNQDGENG